MIKQLFKRKEPLQNRTDPLAAGEIAPSFILPATTKETVSLDDYRGQPVVLVFYPADHSSVCSSQLALYNEAHQLFLEYDAQILGISVDDLPSHQEFGAKLNLGFPLLSDADPKGKVSRFFGVYNEKDQKSERALFVIDGQGVIHWTYLAERGENPGANGILEALESLNSNQ